MRTQFISPEMMFVPIEVVDIVTLSGVDGIDDGMTMDFEVFH